ncbi:IS66 family transposase [Shewanella psychromarinicola]|uniref:IS66 family transposase n=2 Tax=Shewanella psychromarinicola TaxID=2487742 RepID=A0ABN5SRB8_9GAMM|nr:IS66 family transposase [Shewanella psychromarinicola]AZG36442.1 IS66 family transposase [Shewanella psychromarinicola]
MKITEINQLQQTKIQALEEDILVFKQQLDWFKRQLFGRKSEKQLFDKLGAQGSLFATDKAVVSIDTSTDIKAHKRKSNKQLNGDEVNDTGLRFDASVPTKVIDIPAPELQGDDAEHYEIIGYKETNRLAQQPGSYTILIYRRPIVRHKREQTVKTPSAPSNVLEGCYADVSLIAGLMVDKGVYHLPLYRQHQRMIDSGVHISRATLINWVQKGIELLRPIYQANLKSIINSQTLAMDEVPIKAGRKSKGKGKMKQTYFWPMFGDNNEIAFTWSSSRGFLHAQNQLEGFTGTLLTDGYAAYSKTVAKLNEKEKTVTHATCWVHARRYFDRALLIEPIAAQAAIDQIALLYKVEKHIKDKITEPADTLTYRQKHSEPLVTEFFNWVYEQRQRTDLTPQNPLSKALNYVNERQVELKVFLSNPAVAMDTNHLERALRVIPMGRKNYLFCWSELGAEQLGILQSLLVTCRLQEINPYHYLVDVLQRVSIHPASKVAELTPRIWKEKFADNFLTSDLA